VANVCSNDGFYPRDAVLSRYMLWPFCPSIVRYKSQFCRNGRTDRTRFWHRRFFSLIVHCVLRNSGISTDRFNHEFKSLIAGLPVRNWNSNTTDALTPVAWGTCSLNSRRSVALGSLNDMISFNWRSKVKVKSNQSNQSQISLPHGHESLKQWESDRSVPALIVLALA